MTDTTIYDEAAPDLRDRVRALMTEQGLSQTRAAREVGVSAATINQWLGGTYGGDNGAIEAKIARWLEQAEAARVRARTLPSAPQFVATPSAEKIKGALMYAQMAADIAVIYGGAGLSKSSTVRHYAKTAPNVFVATMTPASAGVVTSLEEIAEAVGASIKSGGAARLHKAIVRRLVNTVGILIIDEAQHLSIAALDQIRSIHDAAEVGLALVGNEEVYARMTGGNRAANLDRVHSRIGTRVRLTKPQAADVDGLLDAWKVDDRKCREYLRDIASKPGALRIVTKVLRLGSMYAAGEERALSIEDVRAAWGQLGGVA
jgi:DNA transposition AAA+ family ATPase